MNTEKSIKLMNVIKSILPEHYNFDFGKPEIDEVIKRLQMWEDFKKLYGSRYIHYNNINYQKTISHAMDEVEKEYFPKPKIRKEIRVEVLAENEEAIDELAKDIESMGFTDLKKGRIKVVATRWEKE